MFRLFVVFCISLFVFTSCGNNNSIEKSNDVEDIAKGMEILVKMNEAINDLPDNKEEQDINLDVEIKDAKIKFFDDSEDDSYGIGAVDIFYNVDKSFTPSKLKLIVEVNDKDGNFLVEERSPICSFCTWEGKSNEQIPINLRTNYSGLAKIITKIYNDEDLLVEKTFEKILGGYEGEVKKSFDIKLMDEKITQISTGLLGKHENGERAFDGVDDLEISGKYRLENTSNMPMLVHVKRSLIIDGIVDSYYDGTNFVQTISEPNNTSVYDLKIGEYGKSKNEWRSLIGENVIVKIEVFDANDNDILITEKEFKVKVGCWGSFCQYAK